MGSPFPDILLVPYHDFLCQMLWAIDSDLWRPHHHGRGSISVENVRDHDDGSCLKFVQIEKRGPSLQGRGTDESSFMVRAVVFTALGISYMSPPLARTLTLFFGALVR